jgi:hypothetical protein
MSLKDLIHKSIKEDERRNAERIAEQEKRSAAAKSGATRNIVLPPVVSSKVTPAKLMVTDWESAAFRSKGKDIVSPSIYP